MRYLELSLLEVANNFYDQFCILLNCKYSFLQKFIVNIKITYLLFRAFYPANLENNLRDRIEIIYH